MTNNNIANNTSAYRIVDKNTYRESFGLYFEEYKVGDIIEHRQGLTITEGANHIFTLVTLCPHPVHINKLYAASSEFKQILVSSTYSLPIIAGLSTPQKYVTDISYKEVKLTAPIFIGDTLYVESKVLEKLECDPVSTDKGIVKFEVTSNKIAKIGDDPQPVMNFIRTTVVLKKANQLEVKANY